MEAIVRAFRDLLQRGSLLARVIPAAIGTLCEVILFRVSNLSGNNFLFNNSDFFNIFGVNILTSFLLSVGLLQYSLSRPRGQHSYSLVSLPLCIRGTTI